MAKDKKEQKTSGTPSTQDAQVRQGRKGAARQQNTSKSTSAPADTSYEEAKKHVGHRGGRTTDFGSTSYEED